MANEIQAIGHQETVPEYEKRYIVLEMDTGFITCERLEIEQGYFGGSGGFRIRVTTYPNGDRKAVMTRKDGKGRDRREHNRIVSQADAEFLLASTNRRITKTRYLRDGWEVDFFKGALNGLVLAEVEKPSLEELAATDLPPWISKAIEVTDSVSNAMLAEFAEELRGNVGPVNLQEQLLPRRVPGIVLTGGPCAGKSSVMRDLRATFPNIFQAVPEVATVIIHQVEAEPPKDSLENLRYQRIIYDVQLKFEKAARQKARRIGREVLLLDRGSVDGAAYMQNGLEDLERVTGGSFRDEYDRYHGVIFLETPPREIYERDKENNPARYETYEQAVATGERLRNAWKDHPNFRFIANGPGWEDKLAEARKALQGLLTSAKLP